MQTSTSGGVFQVTEPCRDCRGRGMIVDDPCPVCHGSGRGKSTKTMQVRIPAGVTDGQRIRLKGRGGAGENGGAPGDLYVVVHVRPHPVFGRRDDNLTLTAPVTFAEAALGAEIEVPTPGRSVGQAARSRGNAERAYVPGPGQGRDQAGRQQGRSPRHGRRRRTVGVDRRAAHGAHLVRGLGRRREPAGQAVHYGLRGCGTCQARLAPATRPVEVCSAGDIDGASAAAPAALRP